MSPLHLDAFCQWVIKVFTCKENFDINLLVEHEEQSSHLMDVIVNQVDNESETTIKYWPVCEDWHKKQVSDAWDEVCQRKHQTCTRTLCV